MDLSELYRAAVETSPDGIWVIDLRGHTIYANPEIARIHQIPEAELPGLTVFDILDEVGREQFAAHLEDVGRGDLNDSDVDVQWVRADGSIVWMLVSETALTDDDGRVYALMHRFTDYTERRNILQSLRASEDALADQVAQNTVMQAVTSAANEARTLDEVLVQARDLVLVHDDWTRARAFAPVDGVLLPHLVEGVDDPEPDPAIAAAELDLARECYARRELVWDQSRLTLAFPVLVGTDDDSGGRPRVHAVIVVTSDPPLWRFELIESMAVRISEQLAQVVRREEAESELARARDEAMAASQQKSEFLATMSHEIRTPLNGVIGLNELLLRSRLDTEQHRLASGVQVASRALLDVLNDILDFSKIEAGRLDLERVDFAPRALLDQAAGLLTETARAKGVDLTLSCSPDVPAVLAGDPTRLTQVVTNLVSNAVKFTEHGGVSVTASVAAPEHGAPLDGRVRLDLEVRDTGIGVSAERAATLFDPFTQADTSTTRRFGGTGLGLAICREIVTAMDGEISCAPNPGGGSVFRVKVCLEPGGADGVAGGSDRDAEPDADEAARRVLAGRRVLLVDESADEVLATHLGSWDLLVESVPSVRAATQRLAGRPDGFDLVVASFDTSERQAVQLATRMRAATGEVDLPLLIVASRRDPTPSPPDPTVPVLTRPVLPSALRVALRQVVDEEPAAEAAPESVSVSVSTGPPANRGRILVVEDHPINQMVAEGLLTALGFTSLVVDDGQAGVEAVAAGRFDAVLMDVQMPRLDGYAATRVIREAETSGRRLPIIAMTAAAIEGERERCLSAGMDDYLTKPIDAARLEARLRHWTDPARTDDRPAPSPVPDRPQAPATSPEVLDVERLDELRELDTPAASYVGRAIANFTTNSHRDVPAMQAALDAGDLDEVRTVAHRLAGGALNLGASAAGELLRSVEDRIRGGETTDLASMLLQADLELARARGALQDYLGERSASV